MKVAKQYNNCLVVVENNDVGQVVCNAIHYEYEYENLFVESTVKSSGIGVTMTKKIKRIGCSNLKDIIEMNKLEITDLNTINEIATFEVKGSSYQASEGNHDDLVMNLVMFGYFVSTAYFNNLTDINIKEMIFNQKLKEIEEDIVPFGFIDDGEDQIKKLEVTEEHPWAIEYDKNL
jgi:hypothetical protein